MGDGYCQGMEGEEKEKPALAAHPWRSGGNRLLLEDSVHRDPWPRRASALHSLRDSPWVVALATSQGDGDSVYLSFLD